MAGQRQAARERYRASRDPGHGRGARQGRVPDISSRPSPTTTELPEQAFDLEAHLESVRRSLIVEALVQTSGRQVDAARRLGISFRSLRYYVKKHGITVPGPGR